MYVWDAVVLHDCLSVLSVQCVVHRQDMCVSQRSASAIGVKLSVCDVCVRNDMHMNSNKCLDY